MLGTFYPSSENKKLEFKEFYLKVNPEFVLSESELRDVVFNGKWNKKLNNLIDINLKTYMKYYIPKYISCFLNSNLSGKIIFGINDDSEISGIPYMGDININEIKSYIKSKIPKYVRGISNFDNISIEINKLEVDVNILEDSVSNLLFLMEGRLNEYNRITSEYKAKKKEWLSKINKFSTRFYNILNVPETRNNLLQFCKERNANTNIIELLASSNEIEVELNEIFYKRFKDVNDVMHWAGEFKDYNIDLLQKIKPAKGELPKLISPSMILSKITDFNYKFFNNNENINFYTITINIDNIDVDEPIEFRLPGSKEWYYRERISLPSGPGCI